jgi:SPP1 gp7 family putative phage head morphogenesis protein
MFEQVLDTTASAFEEADRQSKEVVLELVFLAASLALLVPAGGSLAASLREAEWRINGYFKDLTGRMQKSIVNNSIGWAASVYGSSIPIVPSLFGKPFHEQMERIALSLYLRYEDAVKLGRAKKDPLEVLRQRIEGTRARAWADSIVGRTMVEVEMLLKTAVTASINDVLMSADTYGYQYVAVMDSRTTPLCRGLNGKTWKKDGTPIYGDREFPGRPPLHWGCRSILLPIDENGGFSLKQFEEWATERARSTPFLRPLLRGSGASTAPDLQNSRN